MEMPMLKRLWTSRQTVDAFSGMNRGPRAREGEFAQMENLSSDFYPVLAPSPPKQLLGPENVSAIGAGDTLYYTQGRELVLGQRRIDLGLDPEGPKQLVNMGAYVIVFPDKKYASTVDERDYGSLEARFRGERAVLTPCDLEERIEFPGMCRLRSLPGRKTAACGWIPPPAPLY